MASFAQTVKTGEGLCSIQAENLRQYLKVIHIGTTRIVPFIGTARKRFLVERDIWVNSLKQGKCEYM
jgi:hypothetical protein